MPTTPTRLVRHFAAAAVPLALAGCGGDTESFAPPCPQPTIFRDTGDLHRFRGTQQAGGRDIIDSILDGRITDIQGSCKRDGPDTVVATVSVGLELTRGPASNSRLADVAYFIAVSDGDKILDKRVFTLRAEFPPNTEHLRLIGNEVDLRLPVTPKKTAAAYRVSAGFQLTPAELNVNRTLPRR